MINVFSTELTPRIEFAFRLIFENILNAEVNFIQDEDSFMQIEGVKLNYSEVENLGGLQLKPKKLLFEHHLQVQYPDIFEWEGEKALFAVPDSFIPFDLFAASFYLVSRYEEYLPGKRDGHGRFMARKSCAGTNGFLEKPLVNIWAWKLAEIIESKYSGVEFRRSKFKYVPTIDIDNAWAFKNKGFFRIIFSLTKDILKGRWKTFRKRLAVVNRLETDPYDNYDYMLSVYKEFNFRPTFFFLLNKKGKHDRSLSHKNLSYRSLILRLGKVGKLGIHPSYLSNKSSKQLTKEVLRLETITGRKVKRSRQHFLKMSMPTTYRRLIENGIQADYSMCYASRPGFRASIASSFMFFDVLNDCTTNLKIHPFQVMDVTLLHYRGMRASDALKKIKQLLDETAKVGGTFISLWHNETLSDQGEWKGWRQVYTEMTAYAAELRNGNTNQVTA